MESMLRRLAILAVLVVGLSGAEHFTDADVPGIDPEAIEARVTEVVGSMDVDKRHLPGADDLPHINEFPGFENLAHLVDRSGVDELPRWKDLPSVDGLSGADLFPSLGEVADRVGKDIGPQPSSVAGEVDGPHTRIVSWNLYNWGRTKDDQEIEVAAETLRDFDLVAVQEVVTSPPGAQAVAKLNAALDRTGTAWDYCISDPTTGDGSERYAFLWKPSRVRLVGQAWRASSLADPIDREPYLARFKHRKTGQRVLVASLHAVPTSKHPGREVRMLDALHRQYEDDHIVLLGDFNLSEDDAAFDGLRRYGYRAVLDDQPTSLRRKRRAGPDGHLANTYDNVFVETGPLRAARGGVLDFTTHFSSLREARSLSDHLPVYVDMQWTAPPRATP